LIAINLLKDGCLLDHPQPTKKLIYQSLVGLVVIGARLGMEDCSSILRNCDREKANHLMLELTPNHIRRFSGPDGGKKNLFCSLIRNFEP
jgi:hypothetical protein